MYNDTLPIDIRLPLGTPGISDKMEDKILNTLYLATYFKEMNVYAHSIRHSKVIDRNVNIWYRDDYDLKITVPMIVKYLDYFIHSCDESFLLYGIIDILHLREIRDYMKNSMSIKEYHEYKNYYRSYYE